MFLNIYTRGDNNTILDHKDTKTVKKRSRYIKWISIPLVISTPVPGYFCLALPCAIPVDAVNVGTST